MDEQDNSSLEQDLAGIAAEHPDLDVHPLRVGPSTGDEFNTLRLTIFPIACWRLDDVRFEFDSSFIKPEVSRELRELAGLRLMHPKAPLSVFGHADPVGDDIYNKRLSGRRALVIYGLLTRDVKLWEKIYTPPVGGDNWGLKSVQVMLLALGHDPGPIDGLMGSKTSDAIRAFEGTPSGQNTAGMRAKLFAAYMDKICVDEFGKPFSLSKTDFLAQGKHAELKGDVQGCSEFNPVLMFSKTENDEFKKPANHPARNAANTPNRRVVVLLFRPGSVVDPNRWPCPSATAGPTDCHARFFLDAPKRREFQALRREFEVTEDTFACRFYHRLVESSPCERTIKYWVLRILHPGPELIPDRKPVADTPFELTGAGGKNPVIKGRTDAKGILRVQVFDEVCDMTLKIAGIEVKIEAGKLLPVETGEDTCKRRLCNMGYGPADHSKWKPEETKAAFEKFQGDFKLDVNGTADGPTQAKLKELHGS